MLNNNTKKKKKTLKATAAKTKSSTKEKKDKKKYKVGINFSKLLTRRVRRRHQLILFPRAETWLNLGVNSGGGKPFAFPTHLFVIITPFPSPLFLSSLLPLVFPCFLPLLVLLFYFPYFSNSVLLFLPSLSPSPSLPFSFYPTDRLPNPPHASPLFLSSSSTSPYYFSIPFTASSKSREFHFILTWTRTYDSCRGARGRHILHQLTNFSKGALLVSFSFFIRFDLIFRR